MITKTAIGLGLRIPHYRSIFSQWPAVDFFEIISENFMAPGGPPLENLEKILKRYPVVLHGVSLGLGSAEPLDRNYLSGLKQLVERTDAPYFTDHLCWNQFEGVYSHDLLPLPYTETAARYLAEKARQVQDVIDRPFGIENLSSYVEFADSEMTEWEFYNRVIELSGCHYMLDINNIYVSAHNHGFDAREYLHSIRWDRVLQAHLAGHSRQDNGLIIDTHDAPVCSEVWELYREAWKLSGGFPTLLERDDKIPPFEELWAEARLAKSYRKTEVLA